MSGSPPSPRVVHKGGDLTVNCLDQPDPNAGSACHKYEVVDGEGNALMTIDFQHGPIGEHGVNGVQHAELLAIVADRLRCFQLGTFSSALNEIALNHVQAAMAADAERTTRRALAGTEGFNRPAKGVEK